MGTSLRLSAKRPRTRISPSATSRVALLAEEKRIALDPSESVNGIIQTMRCLCECATIDGFVKDVFDNVTKSWPADQTTSFQKAMTRILPAVWPKALQQP